MFEIGASLREARDRRRLGYEQVEAETKIRAKYIRCLEEEDFGALPSGTYVKGFLRTYADYLGLDGQLYVDEYVSRFGSLHDEATFSRRDPRPRPRRESSNVALIALAGIVSICVLFFVAWKFGAPQHATPLPSTPTAPQIKNKAVTAAHRQRPTTRASSTRARTVSLKVVVGGAGTWLEIRRIGATKPIFDRTLTGPATVGGGTLRDPRGFVITAGRPGAIVVNSNGRSYPWTGTAPQQITADGIGPAAP